MLRLTFSNFHIFLLTIFALVVIPSCNNNDSISPKSSVRAGIVLKLDGARAEINEINNFGPGKPLLITYGSTLIDSYTKFLPYNQIQVELNGNLNSKRVRILLDWVKENYSPSSILTIGMGWNAWLAWMTATDPDVEGALIYRAWFDASESLFTAGVTKPAWLEILIEQLSIDEQFSKLLLTAEESGYAGEALIKESRTFSPSYLCQAGLRPKNLLVINGMEDTLAGAADGVRLIDCSDNGKLFAPLQIDSQCDNIFSTEISLKWINQHLGDGEEYPIEKICLQVDEENTVKLTDMGIPNKEFSFNSTLRWRFDDNFKFIPFETFTTPGIVISQGTFTGTSQILPANANVPLRVTGFLGLAVKKNGSEAVSFIDDQLTAFRYNDSLNIYQPISVGLVYPGDTIGMITSLYDPFETYYKHFPYPGGTVDGKAQYRFIAINSSEAN